MGKITAAIAIGIVLTAVFATIAGAIWGAIIYTIANYLIGFQVTALQAFGGGLLIYFIVNTIRRGSKKD